MHPPAAANFLMTAELTVLLVTAATIGVVHTLLGPDHYVPFIALARARGWSVARTLRWTLFCGVGHVLGSISLGLLGVAFGIGVSRLEAIESTRGEVAAWLLITLGTLYLAWGLHRATRHHATASRAKDAAPGAEGAVSDAAAAAPGAAATTSSPTTAATSATPAATAVRCKCLPTAANSTRRQRGMTAWVLFLVFVLGPCEALIPVLMYPAATAGLFEVALVTGVFALATVLTMALAVGVGLAGVRTVAMGGIERFGHAIAGATILACGLGLRFLGL